jgi:hypothetical protein
MKKFLACPSKLITKRRRDREGQPQKLPDITGVQLKDVLKVTEEKVV